VTRPSSPLTMLLSRHTRREFIAAVGAVAAWPLALRGQQPAKVPIIGFLSTSTPSAWSHNVAAFVQRLRELGWIEGRNVAIEYRWETSCREDRLAVPPSIWCELARLATPRSQWIPP
jgi:putative ABC transport system substrate-binding protein